MLSLFAGMMPVVCSLLFVQIVLSKRVHGFHYCLGLFVCDYLAFWQAQHFVMNFLGYRQAKLIPIPIGFLFMRGDRIVDERLNTVVVEVLEQIIAVGGTNNKQVKHVRLPI